MPGCEANQNFLVLWSESTMWRVQRSLWIPSQWRQTLSVDTFHFALRPTSSISQQMQQRSPGICLTHQILVFGCWVCLTWRSEFPQKSSTNVSVTSFNLPSPTSFWGHSSRAFSLNSLGLCVSLLCQWWEGLPWSQERNCEKDAVCGLCWRNFLLVSAPRRGLSSKQIQVRVQPNFCQLNKCSQV